MSRPGSIFISYRRSDSIAETGRIYDSLASHFGREHVFKDVDSIPFGVDFAEYLDQTVSKCQVVLVIIGKTWLNVTEPDGTRRIDNPNDFVRIEVESALRRDIPVIPVLLEGSSVPSRSQLPKSLQSLARRNATEVGYDRRFHADMNRLIKGIETLLESSKAVSDPIANVNVRRLTLALSAVLSRRRLLQIAGISGGGLGAVLLGRTIVNVSSTDSTSDRFTPQPLLTEKIFNFEVVTVNAQGEISDRRQSQATALIEKLSEEINLEMVVIPGGRFQMGSPEGKGDDDERPQHLVTVEPFSMGKYQITQAQWKAVAALPRVERDLNPDPSKFKGDDRPVEKITWYDAVKFCQRLSQKTGREYRPPSEAEWEYACRAGTTTPFHFGETITTQILH